MILLLHFLSISGQEHFFFFSLVYSIAVCYITQNNPVLLGEDMAELAEPQARQLASPPAPGFNPCSSLSRFCFLLNKRLIPFF